MRPADITTPEQAQAALERLGKWRVHFAGWLLGTRPKSDPQSQWARDTAEKLLILRAETNAVTRILLDRKVCTPEEFHVQVGQEAEALSNALSERWPGVTATDEGLSYDLAQVAQWMRGWLP